MLATDKRSYCNVNLIWTDDPCNMIQVYVCSKSNCLMPNVTCYALNHTIVYASSERRLMHFLRPSLSAFELILELPSGLLSLAQSANTYGYVLRHLFCRHSWYTKDVEGHQKSPFPNSNDKCVICCIYAHKNQQQRQFT